MVPEADEMLSVLFRTYVAQIRGYVRTLVHGDDVDDIVAATFRTAYARLGDIPAEAQRAWLYGVARNHVHNHVRAERRRALLIDAIVAGRPAEAAPLFANQLDPVEHAPLLAALRRLTESEREILELAAWYGMDPKEIAEVLGIEPNTARVRLHRARRRLISDNSHDLAALGFEA